MIKKWPIWITQRFITSIGTELSTYEVTHADLSYLATITMVLIGLILRLEEHALTALSHFKAYMRKCWYANPQSDPDCCEVLY